MLLKPIKTHSTNKTFLSFPSMLIQKCSKECNNLTSPNLSTNNFKTIQDWSILMNFLKNVINLLGLLQPGPGWHWQSPPLLYTQFPELNKHHFLGHTFRSLPHWLPLLFLSQFSGRQWTSGRWGWGPLRQGSPARWRLSGKDVCKRTWPRTRWRWWECPWARSELCDVA